MTNPANQVDMLERELANERKTRQELVDSGVRLNSTLNFPELIYGIIHTAEKLISAERASVILLDEADNEMKLAGPGDADRNISVPADQGIAGWVLTNSTPLMISNAAADSRFLADVDAPAGVSPHSMLAVPLTVRDRAVGVLEFINKSDAGEFDQRDLDIATALASQAAVAIDNSRLYQLLTETLIESRRAYHLF
jgi:GAF domain-containing protein